MSLFLPCKMSLIPFGIPLKYDVFTHKTVPKYKMWAILTRFHWFWPPDPSIFLLRSVFFHRVLYFFIFHVPLTCLFLHPFSPSLILQSSVLRLSRYNALKKGDKRHNIVLQAGLTSSRGTHRIPTIWPEGTAKLPTMCPEDTCSCTDIMTWRGPFLRRLCVLQAVRICHHRVLEGDIIMPTIWPADSCQLPTYRPLETPWWPTIWPVVYIYTPQ